MKRLLTIHLVQQMDGAPDLGNGLDVAAVKLACDLSEGASAAGRATSRASAKRSSSNPRTQPAERVA
jgi:hypothetical protein